MPTTHGTREMKDLFNKQHGESYFAQDRDNSDLMINKRFLMNTELPCFQARVPPLGRDIWHILQATLHTKFPYLCQIRSNSIILNNTCLYRYCEQSSIWWTI